MTRYPHQTQESLFFFTANEREWTQTNQLERRHFSRNPKWDPSDFGCKKSGDGHCFRRPTFVLRPSRRALRAAPGLPQGLDAVSHGLHFASAGAHAPHSDETPGPTATRGSSHSTRRLRSLAFLCSSVVASDDPGVFRPAGCRGAIHARVVGEDGIVRTHRREGGKRNLEPRFGEVVITRLAMGGGV